MPLEGTFYTVEEAAQMLSIAPSTLRSAIRLGRVTVVRVGGRVFLTPPGLEEYRTTILGHRGWTERKNPEHEPDRRAAERQRAYRERRKRGEQQRTQYNEEE